MDKEKAQSLIKSHFQKKVRNDRRIHSAYLLVHSEKYGIHLNMAEGSNGSTPADVRQPYYTASVGKLFTSVLAGMLVEQGQLRYSDRLADYLDQDLLHNLHIYNGADYTAKLEIRHLLNHTSGLNDFYDDKPKRGKSMMDLVFDEPSRFWAPREIVEWAKEHLSNPFPPGKGFHYSDTNYILLGLVIEAITGKPFHEVLKQSLFHPLGMKHSHLLQFSEPIEPCPWPVAPFYIRDTNVQSYRSLSVDYAGGGIVAPAEDLLKFMKALVKHEIVGKETFEQMKDWARFQPGIDYGYGLMNVKPVPLIMPAKYSAWGNAGITGAFMFFHPRLDTYFIGSLNQFRYHRKGIMLMFKAITILSRYK